MVLKAGERARNLIKQILAFSRHTEKEVKPFNIAPVIKEALKLLRASLPTTVQIEQDIMPDPGNVLADPSQIHQVMMNLCTNAAHAMRENGGVLKITLDKHFFNSRQITHKPGMRAGAYVRLQVSDTGHGIDPSVIDRVFEPYFTTKKSHEGTGLGLAVVHGIVKGSGGDISVYSEPGQGTVFKILFPSIEQSVEDKSEVEDLAIGRGQRVLFVDDEALLVDVAKQMLPQLGYKVSSFTSSVEALESFRRTPEKFDLVITDYTMPKMTGTQLAREMHSIKPEVSIILCTGFNQNLNQEELSDFGIDALLMKPLYEHELAQVLHRVLDKDRPK
jgi:CheY-like chemotaxis protein